jgi:hypothetical protein
VHLKKCSMVNGPNKEEWRKAIQEEPSNFAKRGVCKMDNRDLVISKLRRKPITTKWVLKKKAQQDGSMGLQSRGGEVSTNAISVGNSSAY